MTLHAIVAALGGDLYQGGRRANVPAPGHSAGDRSVSLLLCDGRVVIHGFGAADWRAMRDHLRGEGFIDDAARLIGGGCCRGRAPAPDRRRRIETASRLWADALPLTGVDPASLHLGRRAIQGAGVALSLRHHPAAPVSVYDVGGRVRPALVACIRAADASITAVELTYLEANGIRTRRLAVSRKTVGVVPPGAAVRLRPVAEEMLVGEGVVSTLSAIDRFQLPGWALMAANNLAAWTPPQELRRLLIAADRGPVGEGAAERLRNRVSASGVEVRIACPDPPFDDWNAVACDAAKGRSEGGGGRRSGGDRPRRLAGDLP